MYIPRQCKNGQNCAVLLTSEWSAMKFVIQHIRENNLYVKVLFLGGHLSDAVDFFKKLYERKTDQSLVSMNNNNNF